MRIGAGASDDRVRGAGCRPHAHQRAVVERERVQHEPAVPRGHDDASEAAAARSGLVEERCVADQPARRPDDTRRRCVGIAEDEPGSPEPETRRTLAGLRGGRRVVSGRGVAARGAEPDASDQEAEATECARACDLAHGRVAPSTFAYGVPCTTTAERSIVIVPPGPLSTSPRFVSEMWNRPLALAALLMLPAGP